ncbi:allantoate amidohydrolase [Nocardioides bigeumensis]|uniref:Allantoate amidohydrolase n=1 Tax=Nocardioides bigeumensis TaxID=433657 RepID=A0ABN2YPS1_9ACTN
MTFQQLWAETQPVGRADRWGGYHRILGSSAELELREWFVGAAASRGMHVEVDRAGNHWAWLGDPDAARDRGQRPLVVGSHLDSVPGGGAFDGALGVVSAFAAIDQLTDEGQMPAAPVAVVSFAEEEGSRFGITCLGSRVLMGSLPREEALALRDPDGVTMAEALRASGADPDAFGPDPEATARIGTYVELHIEQGRGLADLDRPVAVGSAIRPYGRWRLVLQGEGNHAGTTRMVDRQDPMLVLAEVVRRTCEAALARDCVATIGKLHVDPNAANAIPARVTAWLDARGPDEALVHEVAAEVAAIEGVDSVQDFFTSRESFDGPLAESLAELLDDAPVLESGAGHDAGTMAAAGVPSAMLFVRNPTGVSHSPQEHADEADCVEGVRALAQVIRQVAS